MMISFGIYGGFFQELGNTGLGTLSLPLFLLAIPVIFYSGRPILQRAWHGLKAGQFSMDSVITSYSIHYTKLYDNEPEEHFGYCSSAPHAGFPRF